MPYLDNNIPSKKFYASIGCEIPRMIGTTDPISMMKHVNLLVIRMKNEGSECPILKKILRNTSKYLKVTSAIKLFFVIKQRLMRN